MVRAIPQVAAASADPDRQIGGSGRISANTVRSWSTCSAESGMEIRSIPNPTIAVPDRYHV